MKSEIFKLPGLYAILKSTEGEVYCALFKVCAEKLIQIAFEIFAFVWKFREKVSLIYSLIDLYG